MSKFSKKLDQARLKFFGSKKIAGKKMKHDGSGELASEDEYTDSFQNASNNLSNQAIQNAWNQLNFLSNIGSISQNQLNNTYQYLSQQGIFSGSISSSYGSQNNSVKYLTRGIGGCTCPLCVGGNSSNVAFTKTYIQSSNVFIQTNPGPQLPRDPAYNNDFGWRCWSWCTLEKKLYSPIQNVLWPQAENHAHKYDESSMVRGVAGIHARFVPENWEGLECPDGIMHNFTNDPVVSASMDAYIENLYGPNWQSRIEITGLVERFGKFVEGTEGWRSEWAIIRKLYAPTTEIGLSLEQAFPEVEVVYPKQQLTLTAAE